MRQIIWNAIITAIITFAGVLLNWYLLRYKIEPVPMPPSQHVKETMKRIGKRVMKGVRNHWPLLLSIPYPIFNLVKEAMSPDAVTRFTIFAVSINLVVLFIAVILHVIITVRESQREILYRFAELHSHHLDMQHRQALYLDLLTAIVSGDTALASKNSRGYKATQTRTKAAIKIATFCKDMTSRPR